MTPPIESAATQTIATIAFGTIATLISVITIWQGRRAWRKLYGQESDRNTESDLESQSLEAVELETHPSSSDIFELPAASFREHTSVVATASALPEEARLLDSLAFSAPLTPPTTTTVSPA
ncbi:MAG: hypothetical protein ASARMPRED_002581 [Alectoria sarmentosa]|nr:MAG: hypothetical protein ASARMPRED_002581 [Alectoria sarmentosa]